YQIIYIIVIILLSFIAYILWFDFFSCRFKWVWYVFIITPSLLHSNSGWITDTLPADHLYFHHFSGSLQKELFSPFILLFKNIYFTRSTIITVVAIEIL